jgi:hypothetical protein
MSTNEPMGEVWYPDECPSCARANVRPMSLVDEMHYYRCPDPCLWSWRRVHPGQYASIPTCHGDIAPGNECATCGAYNKLLKWKGVEGST